MRGCEVSELMDSQKTGINFLQEFEKTQFIFPPVFERDVALSLEAILSGENAACDNDSLPANAPLNIAASYNCFPLKMSEESYIQLHVMCNWAQNWVM